MPKLPHWKESTHYDSKPPVLGETDKSSSSGSDWDSLREPQADSNSEAAAEASIDKPEPTLSDKHRATIEKATGTQLTDAQCKAIARNKKLLDSFTYKTDLQRNANKSEKDKLFAETFGVFTKEETEFGQKLAEGIEKNYLPFEMQQALVLARIEKREAEQAEQREKMLGQAARNAAEMYAETARARREELQKAAGYIPPVETQKPADTAQPKSGNLFSRFRKK